MLRNIVKAVVVGWIAKRLTGAGTKSVKRRPQRARLSNGRFA